MAAGALMNLHDLPAMALDNTLELEPLIVVEWR
jgi:hypothetical protein